MTSFKLDRLERLSKRRYPGYLDRVLKCGTLVGDHVEFDPDSQCYKELMVLKSGRQLTPPPMALRAAYATPTPVEIPPPTDVTQRLEVCRGCTEFRGDQVNADATYVACAARPCCGGKPGYIPLHYADDLCPKKLWTTAKEAKNLRDTFDRVILVNLKRRPERLSTVAKDLTRCGWPFIEPQLFVAVDGRKIPKPRGWQSGDGAWGCMQSHRQVLERAILDDVRSLLILEDDVTFTERIRVGDEWLTFGDQVLKFLREVPNDWEGLMIGGQHMEEPAPVSPGVVRCWNTQRTHCYAVRGRYMRDLYQYWVSTSGHCDHRAAEIQRKYKVYAPATFLAGQAAGPSDIDSNPGHPVRFWSAASRSRVMTWFRIPRELLDAVKAEGFHLGYSIAQDGRDLGLIDIFTHVQSKELRVHRLRQWMQLIQGEAASANGTQPAMWYPDDSSAVVDAIREAAGDMLVEVTGQNLTEVLQNWRKSADAKDL